MKGQSQIKSAIFEFKLAARQLEEYLKDKSVTVEHMRHRAWIAEGDILQGLAALKKFMGEKYSNAKKT